MFENRGLFIVTNPTKENVKVPLLEKELGVNCFVELNYDPDLLGIFTGNV